MLKIRFGNNPIFSWTVSLLTATAILTLSGCASVKEMVKLQEPSVDIEKYEITQFNLEKIDLLANLQVDNPNPIALNLAGFTYKITVEEETLISGVHDKPIHLPARKKEPIALPLSFTFKELLSLSQKLTEKNQVNTTLHVEIVIELPVLGKKSYSISKTLDLPIPRPPKVSVSDLQIESASFSEIAVMIKVNIENPNSFAINMDRFNYKVAGTDGKSWLDGKMDSTLSIPENGGKSTVSLPIKLKLSDLGSSVASSLLRKKPIELNMSGDMNFFTDVIKSINYQFNKKMDLRP